VVRRGNPGAGARACAASRGRADGMVKPAHLRTAPRGAPQGWTAAAHSRSSCQLGSTEGRPTKQRAQAAPGRVRRGRSQHAEPDGAAAVHPAAAPFHATDRRAPQPGVPTDQRLDDRMPRTPLAPAAPPHGLPPLCLPRQLNASRTQPLPPPAGLHGAQGPPGSERSLPRGALARSHVTARTTHGVATRALQRARCTRSARSLTRCGTRRAAWRHVEQPGSADVRAGRSRCYQF